MTVDAEARRTATIGRERAGGAQFPAGVAVYRLAADERRMVDELLAELAGRYESAEDAAFLADARRIAFSALPLELVRFLARFGDTESSPAVAVAGLDVDDERIGPTPAHWRAQPDPASTLREELYFVLLATILGEPFAWATLQEGRLIANVVPIRNQEREQSGHGSVVTLDWHTEDAFHPFRCDYLGLLALRNDDATPTTFAAVDAVRLDPEQRELLAQRRFVIRSDDEHVCQRAREGGSESDVPAQWVEPPPSSVLFGDLEEPYLRIDPYFMTALPGDAAAEACLRELVCQLDDALEELVLEPGDACFVDNYRAVHGRLPYRPRYDGRDRWLKKIVVTRDLRRSRAARASTRARVLAPAVLGDGALW